MAALLEMADCRSAGSGGPRPGSGLGDSVVQEDRAGSLVAAASEHDGSSSDPGEGVPGSAQADAGVAAEPTENKGNSEAEPC